MLKFKLKLNMVSSYYDVIILKMNFFFFKIITKSFKKFLNYYILVSNIRAEFKGRNLYSKRRRFMRKSKRYLKRSLRKLRFMKKQSLKFKKLENSILERNKLTSGFEDPFFRKRFSNDRFMIKRFAKFKMFNKFIKKFFKNYIYFLNYYIGHVYNSNVNIREISYRKVYNNFGLNFFFIRNSSYDVLGSVFRLNYNYLYNFNKFINSGSESESVRSKFFNSKFINLQKGFFFFLKKVQK